MRAHAFVPIALLLLSACTGSRTNEGSASPSPQPSPAALHSCEEREVTLDGADVVVEANLDGTLASIVVIHAPSEDARIRAFGDARADFGDPHPDTRTQVRQIKDGLTQLTDLCGRPVMASPTPGEPASPD